MVESNYFVPKALSLVCDLPLFDVMQSILLLLYRQCTYRINYPIDSYLIYLTFEAPLPSLKTKVKYSLPNMKEFELTDLSYNVECIVEYFQSPLLSNSNFYMTLYWFL